MSRWNKSFERNNRQVWRLHPQNEEVDKHDAVSLIQTVLKTTQVTKEQGRWRQGLTGSRLNRQRREAENQQAKELHPEHAQLAQRRCGIFKRHKHALPVWQRHLIATGCCVPVDDQAWLLDTKHNWKLNLGQTARIAAYFSTNANPQPV
jgi:hypothetical protein